MSSAAAVVSQVLQRAEPINATFSLGASSSAGGSAAKLSGDVAHWDDQFLKLVGPEVYRRPLAVRTADEMVGWVRGWKRRRLPGAIGQRWKPLAMQPRPWHA